MELEQLSLAPLLEQRGEPRVGEGWHLNMPGRPGRVTENARLCDDPLVEWGGVVGEERPALADDGVEVGVVHLGQDDVVPLVGVGAAQGAVVGDGDVEEDQAHAQVPVGTQPTIVIGDD